MNRTGQLLWVLALLGVLAPITTASPGRALAATKVLYTWKLPSKGHVGLWTISKSVLSFGGDQNSAVFAPYTLHTTNFAVQAEIKNDGPSGITTNLPGYGMIVRTKVLDARTSIAGGSYFSGDGEDVGPEIYWNGQTAGGNALDPKTAWHLYRLQVQGDEYTLLIDGKTMVQYTIPDYPHPTRVGFFSAFYKVQVRNFRVESLGPATTHVVTAPEVQRFNVTQSDLPADGFYDATVHHWLRNEELARLRNVSVESLQARGRIISYESEYTVSSFTVNDLYTAVAAFTTPSGAQAEMKDRIGVYRSTYSDPKYQNYHELNNVGVGDSSEGLVFEKTYNVSGLRFTTRYVFLYVVRGRYTVYLRMIFDADTSSYDQDVTYTLSLARLMDGKVQRG